MMMIWQCVELLIALISVALVETSVQNKRNVKWREHFLPKYDGSLSIFFYCMHRTNTERASENNFYFTSKMVNFVIFHEKPSKAGQTWKKVDRAPGFYDISSFFFTSAYVTSHPSTVIWPKRNIHYQKELWFIVHVQASFAQKNSFLEMLNKETIESLAISINDS